MTNNFFQSPEFKRASTNTADSVVKILFKGVGIAVKGVIDFLKSAISMIAGK
jgi:hypothetical protein